MKNKHLYAGFKEKYGPYALMAGGSYGLGGAYAEALAKRGMNIVLIARDKEKLDAAAKRLMEQYPVDVIPLAADLADFEKVKAHLEKLTISIGLLVYNAAFAPIGLFETKSEDDLAKAAAVNVRTPLLLTRYLCESMIKNGRGGIVLMSSIAGMQGSPKLATYAATKSFNAVLAEGLWKELKGRGIDVTACVAGAIFTPGYQQAEKTKPAPGAMAAGDVAEQALNALGKGPVFIPGAVNKFARFLFMRLLSRKAAVNIMDKNTGGLS
ncbi:MAG: SDR family NAD(P)-dependent oxidoreductase [Spirochaetaceae bacterium]|jgi:short-subunit dehydrogenase|nr:SDR family NAD(P)-dependent oxidoreductase [Spirochaetaceae bacterium]